MDIIREHVGQEFLTGMFFVLYFEELHNLHDCNIEELHKLSNYYIEEIHKTRHILIEEIHKT